MDYRPKSILRRMVEFAFLFALSAFLIRLAVGYISESWRVLVILAVVFIATIAGFRLWKNRARW